MLAHNLKGKGIWIRRVYECENGDIGRIVERAREAGYSHLLVKTSDGDDAYNIDRTGRDFAAELIPRLRQAGIDVWAWHYVYGDPPPFKDTEKARYWELEAQQAVRRCRTLAAMGLQGYIIDAEGEYERIPERANKAAAFCRILRDGLPELPIGLASWKWPSFHGPFPWAAFRASVDVDMPQVYWIRDHNPAPQLEQSVNEFRRLQPALPYVAAGPAFFEHNWRPTGEEISAFLRRSVELGLAAANLWAWDHLGLRGGESYNNQNLNFTAEWAAAAAFAWPGTAPAPPPGAAPGPGAAAGGPGPEAGAAPPPTPATTIEAFFSALNRGDMEALMALYVADPAHVNRDRAERNTARIRDFYVAARARLGNPTFVAGEERPAGAARLVAWSARLPDGGTLDGNDTFNLSPEGKIRFHSTSLF